MFSVVTDGSTLPMFRDMFFIFQAHHNVLWIISIHALGHGLLQILNFDWLLNHGLFVIVHGWQNENNKMAGKFLFCKCLHGISQK